MNVLKQIKGFLYNSKVARPLKTFWLYRLPCMRRKLFSDTSQYGECLFLDTALGKKISGLVVDVGANDGITHSNSHYFINKGWNGILIEPHPAVYGRLTSLYENNQKVACINFACGDDEKEAPLYFGTDGESAEFSTLSHENSEYFERTRSDDFAMVNIRKLSNILSDVNCPRDIDLLSIDAETYDLEVLRGIDFSKHAPKWIITENHKPKNEEKFSLLRREGYTLVKKLGVNTIWKKAGA